MNGNSNTNTNTNATVCYPIPEEINPFHKIISNSGSGTSQQSMETQAFVQAAAPSTTTNPFHQSESEQQADDVTAPAQDEKWGTHVMGHPAVPTCHPGNKKAALWGAPSEEAQRLHYPYLQYSPLPLPLDKSNNNSHQSILHVFNSWSNKAETMANNIWHNLKTAPSVSGAAWAKVNLTAKAITGGGYEPLYKQTFATYPNEKLKKTFACYLSTSTGPVAGTLYLSNVHVAFCSDRPLSFTTPSAQQSWSYYKVMVPLPNVGTINPVVMRENPTERYIQLVTIDGQDFWFMGFVNYDKASRHLTETVSSFVAPAPAERHQP